MARKIYPPATAAVNAAAAAYADARTALEVAETAKETAAADVGVWVHDSGQRYNWAFSREAAIIDRQRWIDDALYLNHMPLECIGRLTRVNLSEIDATDIYVG